MIIELYRQRHTGHVWSKGAEYVPSAPYRPHGWFSSHVSATTSDACDRHERNRSARQLAEGNVGAPTVRTRNRSARHLAEGNVVVPLSVQRSKYRVSGFLSPSRDLSYRSIAFKNSSSALAVVSIGS